MQGRADPRLLAFLALGGCSGPQSTLVPAGPAAQSIHLLGLFMYGGAALVTLLVAALMLVPFIRRNHRPVRQKLFLWGGVALPAVTLTAMIPFIAVTGVSVREPVAADGRRIVVTGHQYWWDVAYLRPDGLQPARTANEIRLPVGEPVEIELRAHDVIHSFWIPALAGKTDMIPGRVNRMTIQADRAGVWRGQCAEYCGLQHALMAFDVTAEPAADFDAWLARLAGPAREPEQPLEREGRALFTDLGCGSCHRVSGVSDGRLGPDLSNVGARRTIGAGLLPNNVGALAGWIASTQHLKPGAAMPSYDHLDGRRLRAVAAYLDGLK
jgi:cytochrome c oxidase subunit 2